ncbi:transposase [Herbaspirillum seropedicae]|nr:transposase [Herbaspirillum seropedicae]
MNANQVFGWRKQYQEGSLTAVKAGETVVPASELAAAIKDIKELQRPMAIAASGPCCDVAGNPWGRRA